MSKRVRVAVLVDLRLVADLEAYEGDAQDREIEDMTDAVLKLINSSADIPHFIQESAKCGDVRTGSEDDYYD